MKNKLGVLVMAHGGPETLDEVPGYLADIRSGRVTSKAILDEITGNYRAIGGRSPLNERTAEQVDALAARFDPSEVAFYTGMRHWSPWIEDAIGKMLDEGVERALSLVLAPHYSRESVKKYQARIAAGEKLHHSSLEWRHIESYHTEATLIRALAGRVKEGLERWPAGERDRVHVIFSAHALPARVVAEGDPYQDQLWETARLVAEAAGLAEERRSWAYQSAGRTPEPWLGPKYEDHLETLAEAGIRDVVAVPVGFVSDHVEILYDLDIQARKKALELGIRLERPPALNDDPLYIDTLEHLVRSRIADWNQERTEL
jgi:ferrochelatase